MIPKSTVDRMVKKAKKLWGLEDWEITWKFDDLKHEGESDPRYWTEHMASITIDRETAEQSDRAKLFRIVMHEVGHAVVFPIWRSLSDFTDNHLKSKERAVYEDCANSAENIVIDHIITKVFKL